jgi:hypothetical protein
VKKRATITRQTKMVHRIELTEDEVSEILIAHAEREGWIPPRHPRVSVECRFDGCIDGALIEAVQEESSEEPTV